MAGPPWFTRPFCLYPWHEAACHHERAGSMYRSGASLRVRNNMGAPGGSSADAVSDSAATARTSSQRGRRTAFSQRPEPHSASSSPSS